jgi:hypothetical protein
MDWCARLESNHSLLPTTTFSNTLAGNTFEYCVGKCIFGSGANGETTLRLLNSLTGTSLQLAFNPDLWMNASTFSNTGSVTVALIPQGTLTEGTLPLPGSAWLLVAGLAAWLLARWSPCWLLRGDIRGVPTKWA